MRSKQRWKLLVCSRSLGPLLLHFLRNVFDGEAMLIVWMQRFPMCSLQFT